MVRRDLGRHRHPLGLGRRHQGGGAGRGQVQQVQAGTGHAGEGEVAHDHELLGFGRDARHPEAARPLPLVHVPPGGEVVVLAVLGQGDAQAPGVLEGPAHDAAVLDPGPVVCEEAHPERGQLAHGGEALAGPPHRDGARHRHLARHLLRQRQDLEGHPALSMGGSVLGMATTAVNPPRAAERAPVLTVSASSDPGWRRCTCRSTSPGVTRHPPASSTVAPRPASSPAPTSITRPPRTTTSATRSPPSSTTVPPRISTVGPSSAAAARRLRHRSPRASVPGRRRAPRRASRAA